MADGTILIPSTLAQRNHGVALRRRQRREQTTGNELALTVALNDRARQRQHPAGVADFVTGNARNRGKDMMHGARLPVSAWALRCLRLTHSAFVCDLTGAALAPPI